MINATYNVCIAPRAAIIEGFSKDMTLCIFHFMKCNYRSLLNI
jgi:hypothetical protein